MFRPIVITLTLLLALPAFANATWYVTASKSGGDANCRVKPAGTTAVAGFTGTFKNISTVAGTGYQVNRVTIDGVTQCTTPAVAPYPACVSTLTSYQVNYLPGKTYRTLVAYFGPATVANTSIIMNMPAVPVTTPPTLPKVTYRVISMTGNVPDKLTNILKGADRTIAIIPFLGYAVDDNDITFSGPDMGSCSVQPNDQFLGAKNVVCTTINDAITVTVATPAVSQTVIANAGPDRTMTAPSPAITLNGSATYIVGPVTYQWTATENGVHFGNATAASTTFYTDAPGTYHVKLVATAGGISSDGSTDAANATIVVADATQSAENVCTVCHLSRNRDAVVTYDASDHKANDVTCQNCHDPSNTGHYTVAEPEPDPTCIGACHTADYKPKHFEGFSAIIVSPYETTPGKGQYVSARDTCASCHRHGDSSSPIGSANSAIRTEWAGSAHADVLGEAWKHYKWKAPSLAACQRCHTTAGFVNLMTGESPNTWAATDTAQEVLTCRGCHTNTTGTVRDPGRFKFGNISTMDAGKSNLCVRCHSGMDNQLAIKNSFANFTSTAMITLHYLGAGGMVFNTNGYQFDGKTYAESTHSTIVGTDNEGPCVTCHMDATLPGKGHAFGVVSYAGGVIDTIRTQTACDTCHGLNNVSSISPAALETSKAAFNAAMGDFSAAITAKGITISAIYPYFTVPGNDWDAISIANTTGHGKDVMGACANYNFLLHEPGAYAHNHSYAMQLIYDSIEFLSGVGPSFTRP